jgi:hypothetical protein
MIWNGIELPEKNIYFKDDDTVIYCADCREILPECPKVDLIVTDPPYNCSKGYDGYTDNLPNEEYEQLMRSVSFCSSRLANNQFWVAPRYKLEFFQSILKDSHLIVIRRGASGPFRGGWSDQFEIALAVGKPTKCVSDLWDGIRLKGEGYFYREETYGHPGYTPTPIFSKAISLLSTTSILDPFMGTGTSLVAGKKLGRRCIGIEQSEKYCKIAVDRLRQSVMNLSL